MARAATLAKTEASIAAPSREDFAAMLEQSFETQSPQEGSVIKGTIVSIENDFAVVDVGLKTEGRISLREFAMPGVPADIKVGDTVEVYLDVGTWSRSVTGFFTVTGFGFGAKLPLPVYLYNIPVFTKVPLEPETLAHLAKLPNVCGIKDSGGDLQKLARTRDLLPDTPILWGPEEILLEAMAAGASGGVNGGANMFPELFVARAQPTGC